MRIGVTGSSGLIGSALCRDLEAGGHEVLRLIRGKPGSAPAVWEPDRGYIQEEALAGCEAVVHLAGASIGEGRWTAARKALLRSSRVDATVLLVDHLRALRQGPRVLVSASAVGYYGDRADEVLDEQSDPGEGFLAELTRAWEESAARAEEAGIRTALLRTGIVLDRSSGALPRMALPFRLGAGGRLGSGRQWMSWVSLRDAVRAIRWLLDRELSGPVNVVSPQPVTNAAFTKALGDALHRPALVPTPRLPLRLLIGEAVDDLLFASTRAVPRMLLQSGFEFRDPEITAALTAVLRDGERARGVAA